MLERLQSAMKTVKDSKPSSLLSHRFVTVRRGSPAARSGQIQPGDQLEAVEGRSVVTLPHRDLAQILRRAGNTLRLTIIPRSNTNSSNLSEYADYDPDNRSRKGHRSRQKDSRYYSVDLERGPTGFGFSLRGGSEYNMGLYVLGLMEGGPASRSQKIQVSDQLVEINGDSTVGMTHSQAVEQIRKGGHRIHLVLKKGNGYVPDYDREEGTASPSSSFHSEEPGVAAIDYSLPRDGRRVDKVKKDRRERRNKGSSVEGRSSRRGGGGEGRGTPYSDLGRAEEESLAISGNGTWSARSEERETQRERRAQSLPKNALRGEKERQREREKSRSLAVGRRKAREGAVEREETGKEKRSSLTAEEERRSDSESGRGKGRQRDKKREGREKEGETVAAENPEVAAGPGKALFSFLMPLDDDKAGEAASDVDSLVSVSEVSVSAASVSLSGAAAGSQPPLDSRDPQQSVGPLAPGPWLKPSRQKLSQVLGRNRLRGRQGGL